MERYELKISLASTAHHSRLQPYELQKLLNVVGLTFKCPKYLIFQSERTIFHGFAHTATKEPISLCIKAAF